MAGKRFIMNAGRTSKQGQQINVGKDDAEYQAIVNTLTMHPEDMKALGVAAGRRASGSGPRTARPTFQLQEGKVPAGHDLRPLRPADLPAHGRRDRRHRDADVEGLGGRGRADRCVPDGADAA